MTHTELQETILTCIASESLKRAVRERNLLFGYPDLLTIAYRYHRSFDEMLCFLDLLGRQADAETAEAARRIVARQRRMMETFLAPCPGEVYELTVKEKCGYTHRALCASFEAAKRLHKKFLDDYCGDDEEERAETSASVLKRRIAENVEGMDCRQGLNDEAFYCSLTADGAIVEFDDDERDVCPDGEKRVQPEDEEYSACDLCRKICPHPYKRVVPFPEYLKNGDIVRCKDGGETKDCVWLKTDSDAPDDNIERYYVLDLGGESMKERIWHNPGTKYDVFFSAHFHPSAPNAEKIEITDLDKETREIYLDFMRFFEEYEREREKQLAEKKGEGDE